MLYPEIDSKQIRIRPIRADDAERLRASHRRLSPESRYRRFLAAKPVLSSADARYLVEVDGCDHFALVATLDDEDGSIIAVARFVRLADAPDTAEFAIVVGDDYQGNGLATELLTQLARAAADRGVRHFRATMLADNVQVRRLLHRLAAGETRETRMGSISELEIDLPGAHDAWFARPVRRVAAVLRRALAAGGSFTGGAAPSLRSVSGAGRRLWPRLRLRAQP